MKRLLVAAMVLLVLNTVATAQKIWRQVGYTYQKYDGTAFTPSSDSTSYHYSTIKVSAVNNFRPVDRRLLTWADEFLPYDTSIDWYMSGLTTWSMSRRYIQVVDTNGRIFSLIQQGPGSGGGMQNNLRDDYTYDANGHITSHTKSDWKNNSWQAGGRDRYTYDASGNRTGKVTETYDFGTSTWVKRQEITYAFMGANLTEEKVVSWNAGMKTDESGGFYYYNANNKLKERIWRMWNDTWARWDSMRRDLYGYDTAGNLTHDTTQLRDAFGWVNNRLFEYGYDSSNNISFMQTSNWSTAGWRSGYRGEYGYDTNKLVVQFVPYYKHPDSSTWKLTNQSIKQNYYYDLYIPPPPVVGLGNISEKHISVHIFPNPAVSMVQLRAKLKKAQPVTVVIYDATGRVVKQWSENAAMFYTKTVPLTDMPPGNYTLMLNGQDERLTSRFMVVK